MLSPVKFRCLYSLVFSYLPISSKSSLQEMHVPPTEIHMDFLVLSHTHSKPEKAGRWDVEEGQIDRWGKKA